MLLQAKKSDYKLLPEKILKEYFDIVNEDLGLHICVIYDELNPPKVFLESPLGDDKENISGIVRVFFRVEDLTDYASLIMAKGSFSEDSVRKLTLNVSDLVSYMERLDKTQKKKGKLGIRGITTTVLEDQLCNVEVFWTAEPQIML